MSFNIDLIIEQLFEKKMGLEIHNSDTKNLFAVIGHLKLDHKDYVAQRKIISDLKMVQLL